MPNRCRITWLVAVKYKIEIFGASAGFIGIAEPMIKRGFQSKETCWQCRFGVFRDLWKSLIDPRDPFVQKATEARNSTQINLKEIANGSLCFNHNSKASILRGHHHGKYESRMIYALAGKQSNF